MDADLMDSEGLGEVRAAPELAALLLELGRAIKARRFYPPGDPRFVRLFERTLRAWQADLERHGALEIEVDAQGFRAPPAEERLGPAQLGDLLDELRQRGVARLCLEEHIDAEAFAGLVEVLAATPGSLESEGGLPAALRARVPAGIAIESAWSAPPEAEGDAASFEKPLGVAGIRESEAPSDRWALETLLTELEGCENPLRYRELARRAVELAERPLTEGADEDAHTVAETLARHMAEGAKRADGQAEIARELLIPLASGSLQPALIERAGRTDTASSLLSAQVLVQSGRAAVPALLEAVTVEQDPARRSRLRTLLASLGDEALPELLEALESADPKRVLSAVALLGELQRREAVPRLTAMLSQDDEPWVEPAAHALARIGDAAAVDALAGLLRRGRPELAVRCLALTESPRNVGALAEAVDRALRSGSSELGRMAIHALGKLGRPEATRPLAELLDRRGLWRRRRLREFKLMAAAALGSLPGDEAVGALARAAGGRDAKLRRAAERAIERRRRVLSERAIA